MNAPLIAWFLAAFAVSLVLTPAVARAAARHGIVDRPKSPRKVHAHPTPLLGGIAIYATVAMAVLLLLWTSDALTGGAVTVRHYLGFLLGGLVLIIGGSLDDRYELPPHLSFIAPVAAAIIAVGSGIEIEKLTNPFGGVVYLQGWESDVLVFGWLLVVMYTTKFLDGLDGLATSVSSVGAAMILLLALSAAYFQPDVALLSAVSIGALLGFLAWNAHPASVFLGEGGSTFTGFLIGTLAVISGGKVATALLVLGIPLLDVAWVVLRRWRGGGFASVFSADRKHLHHRLLDAGWSQPRVVAAYAGLAAAFGASALVLQSRGKLVALGFLAVLTAGLGAVLVWKERKGRHGTHDAA